MLNRVIWDSMLSV